MRVRVSRGFGRVLEAAMFLVGAASLLAFGWWKLDEAYYQAEYQQHLEEAFAALDEQNTDVEPRQTVDPKRSPERTVDSEPAATVPVTAKARALANLYGRLTSKSLGLNVAVADGLDATTLRRAAGRLARDDARNTVIAAHRDSFFRPLRNVSPGDEFLLETLDGQSRRYVVDWMKVVEPTDVEAMRDTPTDALTLITCFPFDWIGPAPRRLIVRAERSVDVTAAANEAH